MADQFILPMFPLGLVTYPTVGLNLHIFEKRYRQLMSDVQKDNINFGICAVLESGKLEQTGCEMKLVSVEKTYDDGRLDIKTMGIRRFKILDFNETHPGKLYGSANIEYLDTEYDADTELYEVLVEQIKMIFEIFKIDKKLPVVDANLNTYKLASISALNIDQEVELINMEKEINRQLYLVEHLNAFIPKAKEMEEMRQKVQMNGHFRNLLPPNLS